MSTTSRTVRTQIAPDAMELAIESMFRIYTHRPSAAAREYIANAVDEHVTAGVSEPVDVAVTATRSDAGKLNVSLAVTDHGRGMDGNTLDEVYTQVRRSGKRDDETTVGGFGIGAKSGLAVSTVGFDVITSTGEEAHLLRVRHATGGTLDNHIDQIDPEGIGRGTTVTVGFAATATELADMMSMIQAQAMVNNIRITITGLHHSYAPGALLYAVAEDPEGAIVCHPYAVLHDGLTPLATYGSLTRVAVDRILVRHGVVPVVPSSSGHQMCHTNLAYLANTPYPVSFDTPHVAPNDGAHQMFGVSGFSLDGVSVPRQRESLIGVDKAELYTLCETGMRAAAREIAEITHDTIYTHYSTSSEPSLHDVMSEAILAVEFPGVDTQHMDTGVSGYLTSLLTHAAALVLRDIEEKIQLRGVLMFSSKSMENKARAVGVRPSTAVEEIAHQVITSKFANQGPRSPMVIIEVPDLPEDGEIKSTVLSRVRTNLRALYPAMVDGMCVVMTRSVPQGLASCARLYPAVEGRKRRDGGRLYTLDEVEKEVTEEVTNPETGEKVTVTKTVPRSVQRFTVEESDYETRLVSAAHSWDDISRKPARAASASDRSYTRIDLHDDKAEKESVQLSLKEARELLEDDDNLFLVSSRALSQCTSLDPKVSNAANALIGGASSAYQHSGFTDGCELLHWHGIKSVYVYTDTATSAIRKEITEALIPRMRKMSTRATEYAEYRRSKAVDKHAVLANSVTLHVLAEAIGGQAASERTVLTSATENLYRLGALSVPGYQLERTLRSVMGKAVLDGQTAIERTNELYSYRGPLYALDKGIHRALTARVLGSNEAASGLNDLRTAMAGLRGDGNFGTTPVSIANVAASLGSVSAVQALAAEMITSNEGGGEPEINTESVLFTFMREYVEGEIARFHAECDSLLSTLTGGTLTLAELITAAEAEMHAYEMQDN